MLNLLEIINFLAGENRNFSLLVLLILFITGSLTYTIALYMARDKSSSNLTMAAMTGFTLIAISLFGSLLIKGSWW